MTFHKGKPLTSEDDQSRKQQLTLFKEELGLDFLLPNIKILKIDLKNPTLKEL